MRIQLSLYFEFFAEGSVVTSYNFRTKVCNITGLPYNNSVFLQLDGDSGSLKMYLSATFYLILVLVFLDFLELVVEGPAEYADFWNFMDILNFTLYFMSYYYLRQMIYESENPTVSKHLRGYYLSRNNE